MVLIFMPVTVVQKSVNDKYIHRIEVYLHIYITLNKERRRNWYKSTSKQCKKDVRAISTKRLEKSYAGRSCPKIQRQEWGRRSRTVAINRQLSTYHLRGRILHERAATKTSKCKHSAIIICNRTILLHLVSTVSFFRIGTKMQKNTQQIYRIQTPTYEN